ncbi:MAG: pseudouridine synthase family protein [Myxococcota bacterium]
MVEQPLLLQSAGDFGIYHKPMGWHSVRQAHSDGGPCLQDWLEQTLPAQSSLPEGGVVHRLDVSTSGCVAVALTSQAHMRLRARMGSSAGAASAAGPGVTKLYLALARPGLPELGEFLLYFSSRYKGSKKVSVRDKGSLEELGRCRWRVLRRGDEGDAVALWLLGPGRRHQLRAGLAYFGHPLCGDGLYGAPPDERFGQGAALHAWMLELEGTRAVAPPPAWGDGLEVPERLGKVT